MSEPEVKELLSLKRRQGVSYEEIARNTGRSKSAVWKALHDEHRTGIMDREQILHDIAVYLHS